jgi:hypothetical protein
MSSPPKPHPMPEFWKPTISPEDNVAASRHFIMQRSSAASIRSIGSTTSFRPPIPNYIPECPHDLIDTVRNSERERARTQAIEQEWTQLRQAQERERQGHLRMEVRHSTLTRCLLSELNFDVLTMEWLRKYCRVSSICLLSGIQPCWKAWMMP